MSTYDKYYSKDKDYFGEPHKVLMEFFTAQKNKGSIIDLGAGQGRNALPLCDMGYDVTAVDISQVGLNQINEINPKIKTICADIYTFDVSDYDYILLDSMLHFYKRDFEKETGLVNHILSSMKPSSIFINCMVYKKHKVLMDIINADQNINITAEYKFKYNTSWNYHMLAVEKL